VAIGEAYNYGDPTSSVFVVTTGYTKGSITQINRACRGATHISEIRLVRYANGKHYVDVHYIHTNTNGNNEYINISNLCSSDTTYGVSMMNWTLVDTLASGETEVAKCTVSETLRADSSTKLENSVNLWGNSFNGTSDISGNITMSASGN
jgi:hypothetical protein